MFVETFYFRQFIFPKAVEIDRLISCLAVPLPPWFVSYCSCMLGPTPPAKSPHASNLAGSIIRDDVCLVRDAPYVPQILPLLRLVHTWSPYPRVDSSIRFSWSDPRRRHWQLYCSIPRFMTFFYDFVVQNFFMKIDEHLPLAVSFRKTW